jgi:hypothetical protein
LFWAFLLFLLVLAILAALVFRLPQKFGLLQSSLEKHLEVVPERLNGSEPGADLFVFPYLDGKGSVLVASLDASKGYRFPSASGEVNPLEQAFVAFSKSELIDQRGITQLTLVYFSEKGERLMTMTSSVTRARDLAQGTLSHQDFMKSLDADVNFPGLVNQEIENLQNLLQ